MKNNILFIKKEKKINWLLYFPLNKLKLVANCQSGMTALITIVIIVTATLIMAYSASLLGMGELDMGYTASRGAETFSVADGCMEEAFRRIKLDTSYNGGSLDLGNGSCIIVVEANGNNRTVTVTGTVEEYNKKIKAIITLSNNIITINSWEELSL